MRQQRREIQLKRMEDELKRLREAIAKRNEERQAIVDRRDSRLAVARATFSLEDLPAGRYLARARIRVEGRSEGVVSRPFTYSPAGR